jgi:hypothetical protein
VRNHPERYVFLCWWCIFSTLFFHSFLGVLPVPLHRKYGVSVFHVCHPIVEREKHPDAGSNANNQWGSKANSQFPDEGTLKFLFFLFLETPQLKSKRVTHQSTPSSSSESADRSDSDSCSSSNHEPKISTPTVQRRMSIAAAAASRLQHFGSFYLRMGAVGEWNELSRAFIWAFYDWIISYRRCYWSLLHYHFPNKRE